MSDSRPHLPSTTLWTALVASIGLVVGIGGSIIYFGGALRQIDINTAVLHDLIEKGSPQVQTLKLQFDDIRSRLKQSEDDLRSLPSADTRMQADIGAIKNEMTDLEAVRTEGVRQWAEMIQRIASLEAQLKIEQDLRTRLRDDVSEHNRSDIQLMRERIKELTDALARKEKP